MDVFPEQLNGLPSQREIEFAIEIVPGTTPISQTPYHMVPSELKALKNQLKELIEKGYTRPVPRHRDPCLVCVKEKWIHKAVDYTK